MSTALKFYAVSTVDSVDHPTTIAARSAGSAKYQYWLKVADLGYRIIDMRARSIRETPSEPRGFRDCMNRRGIPFAHIGMRVTVDGKPGRIVGHNDSANLDVLFDGERTPGNCHPHWRVVYFDEQGQPIAVGGTR